jgi:hypothetical protein
MQSKVMSDSVRAPEQQWNINAKFQDLHMDGYF